MKLPEWDSICIKLDDADYTKSPLEEFIYEYEPSLHQQEWRDQFQAAIKHVVALPRSCGACPVNKPSAVSCRAVYNSQECHSSYWEYLQK